MIHTYECRRFSAFDVAATVVKTTPNVSLSSEASVQKARFSSFCNFFWYLNRLHCQFPLASCQRVPLNILWADSCCSLPYNVNWDSNISYNICVFYTTQQDTPGSNRKTRHSQLGWMLNKIEWIASWIYGILSSIWLANRNFIILHCCEKKYWNFNVWNIKPFLFFIASPFLLGLLLFATRCLPLDVCHSMGTRPEPFFRLHISGDGISVAFLSFIAMASFSCLSPSLCCCCCLLLWNVGLIEDDILDYAAFHPVGSIAILSMAM